MRLPRLVTALLGAVLLLTGCTGIATSGPVEEVPMSAQPPGIDVAPQPPQSGVTPTRLVEGFLQAMADPESDYSIARLYLTGAANELWTPAGAIVFDGAVHGDQESSNITGMEVGRLDQGGRYSAGLRTFHHDFGIQLEDGQWRIGAPPEGLLLSRYIFERYYSQVSLYYMSTAGSHVVPDPIHVPETLVTPPTIVEALLDGPAEAISGAVRNALPPGTRMGIREATLDTQGVVRVDLSGLWSGLSDEARRGIGAQLLWSLTAIPRVTGLVLTNDGLPFALPDYNAQGVLELTTQQGYQVLSRAAPSNDLFGVRDGVAGRLGDPFEPFRHGETRYGDLAVSLDGVSIALIDEPRAQLWIGPRNREVTLADTAGLGNLRDPQFVLGTLWLLGDELDGTTVLLNVQRSGEVERVRFDPPDGAVISAFGVSPNRARIAIVLSFGEQRILGLATVRDSAPTSVVAWQQLHLVADGNLLLTDPRSLRWSDETRFALIATQEAGSSVYSVRSDGSEVEDLSPVGVKAVEIAALARTGGGPVAVRTETGAVWRFDPRTRWTSLAESITAISYGG